MLIQTIDIIGAPVAYVVVLCLTLVFYLCLESIMVSNQNLSQMTNYHNGSIKEMLKRLSIIFMLLTAMFVGFVAVQTLPNVQNGLGNYQLASSSVHILFSGHTWDNNAGYGKMWWNPSTADFYTSHSNNTPLQINSGSSNCDPQGFCTVQLPNDTCMYQTNVQTITGNNSCSIADGGRELWALVRITSGGTFLGYAWENVWENANYSCGSGFGEPVLVGQSSGGLFSWACFSGGVQPSGVWSES